MQNGKSEEPQLDAEAQWHKDELAKAPKATVDQLERVRRILVS